MTWTTTLPTTAGVYWCRLPNAKERICEVYEVAGELCADMLQYRSRLAAMDDCKWWGPVLPPSKDTLPSHKLASKLVIPRDVAYRDPEYREFATKDLKCGLLRTMVDSLTMGMAYVFRMRMTETKLPVEQYGPSIEIRCDVDVKPAEFEAVESPR